MYAPQELDAFGGVFFHVRAAIFCVGLSLALTEIGESRMILVQVILPAEMTDDAEYLFRHTA